MPKAVRCKNCNALIKGPSKKIDSGNDVVDLCSKCFNQIDSAVKKVTTGENYWLAILLGAAFGIIGAQIWFGVVVITEYQIGLVAIGVGWLVGLGVFLGSGKKKSRKLQIIAVVIAFLSIILGEYLIANYYLVESLIGEGVLEGFSLLNPFEVVVVVFRLIPENPLTVLFWAIAIWFAYRFLTPPKLKTVSSLK